MNATSSITQGTNNRHKLVIADVKDAGCVTFWNGHAETSLDALAAAWTAEGLPEEWLPSLSGTAAALHCAVKVLGERRKLVRPLDGGGWAIVCERGTDDAERPLSYDERPELTARVDVAGRIVVEPTDHPRASQVVAAYDHHLETITTARMSSWLCKLIQRVDAIALKDNGGNYFVPPHATPTWDRVVRAVHAASAYTVVCLPASPTNEALVSSVVEAVRAEAEAATEKLQAEVLSGKLGARALESRLHETEEMEARLTRYEGVLGAQQEGVRERILALRANVSAALLLCADDLGDAVAS